MKQVEVLISEYKALLEKYFKVEKNENLYRCILTVLNLSFSRLW